MVKFKNKNIARLFNGVILLGAISTLVVVKKNTKLFYTESKVVKKAKVKLDKLIRLIQKDDLILENLSTWYNHMEECIELLNIIPNYKFKGYLDVQTKLVHCENLIAAIVYINQVEKSISFNLESKYGDYTGIKNINIWYEYLDIAGYHLNELYKSNSFFKKQCNELTIRKEKAEAKVDIIEEEFRKKHDYIVDISSSVVKNNDIENIKDAFIQFEELGVGYKSEKPGENMKEFLSLERNSKK